MRRAGPLTLLTTLGLAASLSGCRQQYYVENRYLSEATSLPAAQNKQAAVQVEPAEAYAGDARPTKVPTKYVMFPSLSPEPSVPSPEGYSSVSAPNYAKSRKVGLALTVPGGLLIIGGILGAALGSGAPTGDDCGTVTSGMTDTCMGNRLLGLGIGVPLITAGLGLLVPGVILTGTGFSGRDEVPRGQPNLRYIPPADGSAAPSETSPSPAPAKTDSAPTPAQDAAGAAPATTTPPAAPTPSP
ncbi:MAG: hypothetical protein U1A78_07410 [Polyangia bacterium]